MILHYNNFPIVVLGAWFKESLDCVYYEAIFQNNRTIFFKVGNGQLYLLHGWDIQETITDFLFIMKISKNYKKIL